MLKQVGTWEFISGKEHSHHRKAGIIADNLRCSALEL
jgi:hypothetical protein